MSDNIRQFPPPPDPLIAAAVQWLLTDDPPRPLLPKLRDKFGLNAAEAIRAMKTAEAARWSRR